MKKIMLLLGVLVLLSFPKAVTAQQTGDFAIGFPSPDTLLTEDSLYIYFHVPDAYQPGVPSKLIIGIHGIGDPSTSELIRGYLAPTGDSLNAIIACPDPYLQDQPRSQRVINIALDSIKKWYNIDSTEMYIGGYSAGSDIASQYLLQNPVHRMKGLIWFAPGFFYQPNLADQIDFPPTCLCHGDQDGVSTILGQVEAIKDSFSNSGFPFFFNSIPGVGHTMNFPAFTSEILECMRFIEDPGSFTGLGDHYSEDGIALYPNPNNGSFTLVFDVSRRGDLRIINILGEVISSQRLQINQGSQSTFINQPKLATGIYFVQLQTEKGLYVKRMIIE